MAWSAYAIKRLLFIMRVAYPKILLHNPTNEGLESITSGENNISREDVDKLLEPTKRRGRGKALKTLLAEAESKKRSASGGTNPIANNSSSDEDTPCQGARKHYGSAQCATLWCLVYPLQLYNSA